MFIRVSEDKSVNVNNIVYVDVRTRNNKTYMVLVVIRDDGIVVEKEYITPQLQELFNLHIS